MEELKAVIVLLNKKLHIDHEPKIQKFKKEYLETMIVKETEIYKSFQEEDETHLNFVRKMIEKEFTRDNEESQGFCQKYSIKTFEQIKTSAKVLMHAKRPFELEGKVDKEFINSNNLSHLKLSKPNMFDIVRSRAVNMRDEELKTIINTDFDVFSIVRTVRGMMDSYWLMMQISNDPKSFCTFCEFAYVWLGSYEVSTKTCKIVEVAISNIL